MTAEDELQIKVLLDDSLAEKFRKIKQRYGLKTHSETVRFLIAEEFRRLKPELAPDFEHFNVYDDHITIRDNRIGRYVDIYARNGDLCCELCGSKNCEHIRFAVEIPEVEKALEKKGWRHKSE